MIVAMPCLSLAHSLTHLLPFFCDFIDVAQIIYQKSSLPEESSCYTQKQSQKFGTNLKTKLNISQGN